MILKDKDVGDHVVAKSIPLQIGLCCCFFFFCLLWFMPLDCTLGVMTQLGKSQMVFYQIFMGVPGRREI